MEKLIIKDKKKLKREIISRGFTLEGFSKHIGLSEATLPYAVYHGTYIRPDTARMVADGLNIPFYDLFDLEEV